MIAGCVRLVLGEDVDPGLVIALAGPAARSVLADGGQSYWFRVWGVRGLLWAWDDSARGAIDVALRDPAWRVRELAAEVVARHLVGDALPAVVVLREDPVPRVRTAAVRAVARLTGAGA